MPTAKSLLGQRAEELTSSELIRQGYEIITRNYRCRYGEIDIIAKDKDALVFVEVRSRRSNSPTSPAESIDKKKQSKLLLTAQHYLQACALPENTICRFDVSQVRFERGRPVIVEIIQNAFDGA